jgi:hypothetical protein
VTGGPYRLVRHPIYTSMFCLFLGTGFMLAPRPMLALSTVVFMVDTETRVRIEDQLLASRFGDRFRESTYCPGVHPLPQVVPTSSVPIGNAEDLGNLVVAELLDVAQDDDFGATSRRRSQSLKKP